MSHLHIHTPLIESLPLSRKVSGKVWLKMEALQPSGSFKLRGIGNACQEYLSQGAKRFITSSGGNAGIAVAYSGRKLSISVTVVVPQSISARAVELIEQEGAEVVIFGESWQESHEYSLSLVDEKNFYIHPFDDPLLWKGHASLIDEVVQDHIQPDIVILSVGGGGLLCGVVEGLHRNNLKHVPVLAIETKGADSLSSSVAAGKNIGLDKIQSLATTLGAKKVAETAYEWCSNHPIFNHVVTDYKAVTGCLDFLDEHRILVEPACGATLAALSPPCDILQDKNTILVVVCGGAGVTIPQLFEWNKTFIQES